MDLAGDLRKADLRETDFAGRLTIAIAAFPGPGDTRTLARCLVGLAAIVPRIEPVTVSDLQCLRRFAIGACCCTAFRFMLATRPIPEAVSRCRRPCQSRVDSA